MKIMTHQALPFFSTSCVCHETVLQGHMPVRSHSHFDMIPIECDHIDLNYRVLGVGLCGPAGCALGRHDSAFPLLQQGLL